MNRIIPYIIVMQVFMIAGCSRPPQVNPDQIRLVEATWTANLEQVNAHIDTEDNHAYRLAHIDRAWRNRIDNNLFNLEPGAWMKLPHEEFFQELIRTFPRSYNKGRQLA